MFFRKAGFVRAATAVVAGLVVAGVAGGALTHTQRAAAAPKAPAALPKGYKIVVGPAVTVPAGTSKTFKASCAAGSVAVGGGEENTSNTALVSMSSSYPTGQSWTTAVANAGSAKYTFHAYAICITKPALFVVKKVAVTNPPQSQTEGIAACPSGHALLGGGVQSGAIGKEAINGTTPLGSKWRAFVNNRDTIGYLIHVYAVCGKSPAGRKIFTSSTIPNPGSSFTFGTEGCPGKVPLSGGALSNSSDLYTDINESAPITNGWDIWMDNVMSNATSFTVSEICAGTSG